MRGTSREWTQAHGRVHHQHHIAPNHPAHSQMSVRVKNHVYGPEPWQQPAAMGIVHLDGRLVLWTGACSVVRYTVF